MKINLYWTTYVILPNLSYGTNTCNLIKEFRDTYGDHCMRILTLNKAQLINIFTINYTKILNSNEFWTNYVRNNYVIKIVRQRW